MELQFLNHAIDSLLAYARFSCGGDALLRRAIETARECHQGQLRDGGEPYLIHPVRVATHFLLFFDGPIDQQDLAAAILHDVLEDDTRDAPERLTRKRLAEEFGEKTAHYVDLLTKKVPGSYVHSPAEYHGRLLAASPAVQTMKLCDRFDNLLSLHTCSDPAKVARYLPATESYFAALGETNPALWKLILQELARLRNP